MRFLSDFIKGVIIGIGAVAPGVSGGTFAVMLGIYDKLTDAIAEIFVDIKKKVFLLFPLALGVGVGVFGFSKVIKYLFEYHDVQVKLFFIGLMVGTLPSVIKEANKHGFKKRFIPPCIFTLSITIIFTVLENTVINIIPENSPGIIALIIYGIIIGIGTIIPGISSSFILMYIGAYEVLLDSIANLNIVVLIPVGLGFILSILLFAKVISLLFKKLYGYTYYTVLGFVMGSIGTIFPYIKLNIDYIIGIMFCFLGLYVSLKLCNYKRIISKDDKSLKIF